MLYEPLEAWAHTNHTHGILAQGADAAPDTAKTWCKGKLHHLLGDMLKPHHVLAGLLQDQGFADLATDPTTYMLYVRV